MLVEKAKTKRIKDHKIISLSLKQGSEINNLFIISISFFPGISQTNSMTNSPSLASLIVSVSVTFHRLISAVNLFRSFSFALFFFLGFSSCCKLYHLFFAFCGWLTFQERERFTLQRVIGKQRNAKWIFPQNVTFL